MTTKISEANIQDATLETLLNSGGGGPKISSIIVTNSNYVNLDDTAVALEGGFVKLIGSGFAAGCQVLVGLTPALSVTYISETEVRAQLPATAAGTYIVYLVNTDGGTAIRVNAVTFSGTPTWVTGSALGGVVDTVISLQLTATGATTFALAVGSTLPPGVTLSSGGLLSGTVTGISQETVYNFVINAVDAELQDSPRSFAFTVTTGDLFFNLTTLLLPGNATTFVRDASTNNFPVTVVGDTRPNTFNPYLTGWSNFFDGTGDSLAYTGGASIAFGTGNFTIETWAYLTNTGTFTALLRPDALATLPEWGYDFSTSLLKFDARDGAIVSTSTSMPTNQWVHLVVSRSGTSLRQFINGTQVGPTTTNSTNFGSTTNLIRIGGSSFSSGHSVNGYLSNFRIVNGTAVYTTAFTPPAQPLTAIAGTSLLTCQSNRLRDTSTNNFAITPNGNVTVDSFSPFVEPATTRGSGFFDGTGDSLVVPPNPQTYLSSDSFTIEAWVYPNADNGIIVGRRAAAAARGFFLGYGSGIGANRFSFWAGDTDVAFWNVQLNSADTYPLNQWYHVAATRNSSNVFTLWVNGVSVASTTASLAIADDTSTLQIGILDTAGSPLNGYISNLRIVKNTVVYTTAFTPPTAPLTAIANTSLLTLQNNQPTNNSMFLDSSTENFPITRSGNATQGTFSPYSPSGWSNFFDGASRLQIAGTAALDAGAGNFCIECWFLGTADYNSYTLAFTHLAGKGSGNGSGTYAISVYQGKLYASLTGTLFSGTTTLAVGVWYHGAITRSGSTVRLFLNGVLEATTTNTTDFTSSSNFGIGDRQASDSFGQYPFRGHISNVRLVKGNAVYTANFTPSTTPLTAIAGTSLLTCADNRFIDDSPNNFALTRAGDVRVTNFAPFKAQTQTPQTYSAFFDGTGDYLSAPATDILNFGTGDFTVELWLLSTNITNTAIPLSNDGPSRNIGNITFFISSNGSGFGIQRITTTGGAAETIEYSSAGSVLTNVWNHFAATKVGTTIRLFLNGVLVTTATSASLSWGTQIDPVQIGRRAITGFEAFVTGYISNLRVVKGTAVYTANFTPAAQPLTAVAGTSLLTCQSATFVDNSTNRSAITAVGNSQPSMVNPFGFTFVNSTGYSVADIGGSMSFDGSGDYVSVANTGLFGSGNWTVECWVNAPIGQIDKPIIDARNPVASTGSTNGFTLTMITATEIRLWSGGQLIRATANYVNNWLHIAIVKNSTTTTMYFNGISVGTTTSLGNMSDTGFLVGAGYYGSTSIDTFGNFYISNLRAIKGQAVYTSNFVPPIAPVEPVPNTTLLLNGTGAAIRDATTKNVLETVGDARISTVISRFGGSSMSFDGTGDRLIVPSSPNFDFSGNFTIEMWINFTNVTSTWEAIISRAYAITGGWRLYKNDGTNQLSWWSVAAQVVSTTGSPLTNNTWSHVAVVRNSGTITIYIDGVNRGSAANTTNYNPGNYALEIGEGVVTSSFPFEGYMQDLRITNGVARYTANFTPPGTAFQTR